MQLIDLNVVWNTLKMMTSLFAITHITKFKYRFAYAIIKIRDRVSIHVIYRLINAKVSDEIDHTQTPNITHISFTLVSLRCCGCGIYTNVPYIGSARGVRLGTQSDSCSCLHYSGAGNNVAATSRFACIDSK